MRRRREGRSRGGKRGGGIAAEERLPVDLAPVGEEEATAALQALWPAAEQLPAQLPALWNDAEIAKTDWKEKSEERVVFSADDSALPPSLRSRVRRWVPAAELGLLLHERAVAASKAAAEAAAAAAAAEAERVARAEAEKRAMLAELGVVLPPTAEELAAAAAAEAGEGGEGDGDAAEGEADGKKEEEEEEEEADMPPPEAVVYRPLEDSDDATALTTTLEATTEAAQLVRDQLLLLAGNGDMLPDGQLPWQLIAPHAKTAMPRISASGFYKVRLFAAGAWRAVTIDDRMPVGDDDEPLLVTGGTDPLQLWPMLLSKALLKLVCLFTPTEEGSRPLLLHCLTSWLPRPQDKLFAADADAITAAERREGVLRAEAARTRQQFTVQAEKDAAAAAHAEGVARAAAAAAAGGDGAAAAEEAAQAAAARAAASLAALMELPDDIEYEEIAGDAQSGWAFLWAHTTHGEARPRGSGGGAAGGKDGRKKGGKKGKKAGKKGAAGGGKKGGSSDEDDAAAAVMQVCFDKPSFTLLLTMTQADDTLGIRAGCSYAVRGTCFHEGRRSVVLQPLPTPPAAAIAATAPGATLDGDSVLFTDGSRIGGAGGAETDGTAAPSRGGSRVGSRVGTATSDSAASASGEGGSRWLPARPPQHIMPPLVLPYLHLRALAAHGAVLYEAAADMAGCVVMADHFQFDADASVQLPHAAPKPLLLHVSPPEPAAAAGGEAEEGKDGGSGDAGEERGAELLLAIVQDPRSRAGDADGKSEGDDETELLLTMESIHGFFTDRPPAAKQLRSRGVTFVRLQLDAGEQTMLLTMKAPRGGCVLIASNGALQLGDPVTLLPRVSSYTIAALDGRSEALPAATAACLAQHVLTLKGEREVRVAALLAMEQPTLRPYVRLVSRNNDSGAASRHVRLRMQAQPFTQNGEGYSLLLSAERRDGVLPAAQWTLYVISDAPLGSLTQKPVVSAHYAGRYIPNKYGTLFQDVVAVADAPAQLTVRLSTSPALPLELRALDATTREPLAATWTLKRRGCQLDWVPKARAEGSPRDSFVLQARLAHTHAPVAAELLPDWPYWKAAWKEDGAASEVGEGDADGGGDGDGDGDASVKSEDGVTWQLQIISSKGVSLVADSSVDEHEADVHERWNDGAPGRAMRARLARATVLSVEADIPAAAMLADEREAVVRWASAADDITPAAAGRLLCAEGESSKLLTAEEVELLLEASERQVEEAESQQSEAVAVREASKAERTALLEQQLKDAAAAKEAAAAERLQPLAGRAAYIAERMEERRKMSEDISIELPPPPPEGEAVEKVSTKKGRRRGR